MNIPLVDLKAQYQTIKPEIDQAIADVIAKTAFISGPFAKKFEEEFAAYLGRKHCIAVGNGTDAISAAMYGLDLKPGDEVIIPAKTFIATGEAVSLLGGRIVFADIDPVSRNIDPAEVEKAITPKTKGIIAVHLYGRPADMPALRKIADAHGLWLVEDSAQAHGATIDGKTVGAFSNAATFSFYPGKNLGAYGDAGAVVTDDEAAAEKIRMWANHGRLAKYGHLFEGTNSRMDGLQGAILSVKLKKVDEWRQARRNVADAYRAKLADLAEAGKFTLPEDHPGHVYHLFVLELDDREALLKHLKDNGVGASIHYPDALPRLKAYEYLGHKPGDFPYAEALAARCLSLPIYPELTGEQIDYVVDQIRAYFS